MASDKTVYARVTNSNGTFLANWFNIDFRGYEKTLNGGVGECVIDYAVPFDYDGSDLREGNDVELILRDKDTVEGSDDPGGTRLIYKGYISLIERVLNPGDERVIVHILGYYTLLALDILRSSSNTTLYSNPGGLAIASVDLEASDIGQIAQAVLNTFNIHSNPGKLFWTDESIPTLATEAAYTFVQKTYREALDILKAMAPPNTYWYADETGKVSFKPAPTEPTHTFIAKRHVATLRVEKSLEKVRNVLAIWNGSNGPSVYKSFSDDASIAQYGRRAERINDFGINGDDADDAMAAYAAKFLAENKDPSIKIVATIIDNNSGISAPGDALVPRLEANLVSNSGFENDDDWTVGAGWSNSGGREHFTVGATGRVIGDQASKSVVGETGYVVNDVLTLVGGDNNAQIRVTAVDGFGAIDAWETVAIGTNYLANSFCSTTGGTGTGAQFYVPFVFTEPLSIPLNTVAGTEYRTPVRVPSRPEWSDEYPFQAWRHRRSCRSVVRGRTKQRNARTGF